MKLSGGSAVSETGAELRRSASSLEFNFTGSTEIYLNGTAKADMYFTVYLNGERQNKRVKFTAEDSSVLIADGLAKSNTYTVKLVRETEEKYGAFTAHSLNVGYSGRVTSKPADSELFIQFIGDSAVCGNGALSGYLANDGLTVLSNQSGTPTGTNDPLYEDATNSFAYLTAEKLGADCDFISESGGAGITQTAQNYTSSERTPDLVVINFAEDTATAENVSALNIKVRTAHSNNDLKIVWIGDASLETVIAALADENVSYCNVYIPTAPTKEQAAAAAEKLYDYLTNSVLAAERYSVSVEYGNFTSQEIASIGTNLLSDGTFQPKLNLSGCSDTYSPERGEGVKVEKVTPRLWDDKPDTYNSLSASKYKWKVNNGVMYIDIWFDLQNLYKIDKLFINHYNGTIACLKTGEYEIYASKDLESLFESESRIIKYDNTASSKNRSTVSQLFTVGGGVVARYVSFRILCPVNDFNYAKEHQPGNLNVRISELGIYGSEYVKPATDTNLIQHAPLTVYRNTTEVSESEFGVDDYKLLCDGYTDAPANISSNSTKLNFVFDLCTAADISGFSLATLTANTKSFAIYTSQNKSEILTGGDLISSSTDSTLKTFAYQPASPVNARYVRFSVESVNDIYDPVEIKVIGKDNQQAEYKNLDKTLVNNRLYLLQDNVWTDFTADADKEAKCCVTMRPFTNLIDKDPCTLYDVYAGKNNEQSVNIILDLNSQAAIDMIKLTAGSNEKYWPTKVNFYFDNNLTAIKKYGRAADKSFTAKTEDGVYSFEFIPQSARYVRIEIAESDNPYMGDTIISVISEIAVNGISIGS